jgi:hypothetical protein
MQSSILTFTQNLIQEPHQEVSYIYIITLPMTRAPVPSMYSKCCLLYCDIMWSNGSHILEEYVAFIFRVEVHPFGIWVRWPMGTAIMSNSNGK